MKVLLTRASLVAIVLFAMSGPASAQLVSPAAPAVAPTTIWNRLGIPYGFNRMRDNAVNRRGNVPGLERKPLLKAIADPANLESDNPAIKRAAEIKQAEDMAPQKIKALKYLAKIGCGCYDQDGSVTDALLAAMKPEQECTADVRKAAVEAVKEAADGGCCSSCGSKCCCNEKIAMQLSKMAYERNDDGCYYEPVQEIREAAAEALRACCPGRGPVNIIQPEPTPVERPREVPEVPETAPPAVPDNPPSPLDSSTAIPLPVNPAVASLRAKGIEVYEAPVVVSEAPAIIEAQPLQIVAEADEVVEPLPLAQPELEAVETPLILSEPAVEEVVQPAPAAELEAASDPEFDGIVELAAPPVLPTSPLAEPKAIETAEVTTLKAPREVARQEVVRPIDQPVSFQKPAAPREIAKEQAAQQVTVRHGQVAYVDARNGVIHLSLPHNAEMEVGSRMTVYHNYITGQATMGEIEVVQSSPGAAIARPLGLAKVWKIARGDDAILSR